MGARNAIIARRRGLPWYAALAANGNIPGLSADFANNRYWNSGAVAFSDLLTSTCTAASTMVDATGLLKWSPHNLTTYSDDLTNAAWTKVANSVTLAAGAGPNGMDAFSVIPTAVSSTHTVYKTTPANTNLPDAATASYTTAIYAKANGYNFIGIAMAAGVSCTFNLSTGAIDGLDTGGETASITDVGDGWYFCQLTTNGTLASQELFTVNAASGTYSGTFGRQTFTGDGTSGVLMTKPRVYRSDLGGMVNNPDRGDSYVPTTASAVFMPRRNHHVYDGTSWVNRGILVEPEAATNLLLNSGTLSTQSATVTAVAHTLHFTGTGTVTLSGVSTAGPLVGTGTGENNRVSLTFTPTAGSLTLTVSGAVTNAQLEVGSVPTSYIPTAGATATRPLETLAIPAANIPTYTTAVSIQMDGLMTYADEGTAAQDTLLRRYIDASNYITYDSDTDGAATGEINFNQATAGVLDTVASATTAYAAGVNVPFNIAARHGSTFINGAVDGTALTENATPVAIADLSAANIELAYSGGPMIISTVSVWPADITDAGIAEASA